MGEGMISKFNGVIPAMLTPFDESEALDLNGARELTRYLCAQPIGGLYLTGSTGEGFMMTTDERKAFVEAVIDEVGGRVPVVVHVGAISARLSEELARHAAQCGAAGISSVPPIYWKFSDDNIAKYYADLVQAAGIPMIVYNIALAGLVSFDMIKRLGSIPGVEGIKYTSATHFDMFRIKEALGQDFAIYSGSDEMAMSGLTFGADGIIGSTYNVLAEIFAEIYAAVRAGDIRAAEANQHTANRVIFAMIEHDLMPALKLALSWLGVNAGISRRPFTVYDEAQRSALKRDMCKLAAEIDVSKIAFLRAIVED